MSRNSNRAKMADIQKKMAVLNTRIAEEEARTRESFAASIPPAALEKLSSLSNRDLKKVAVFLFERTDECILRLEQEKKMMEEKNSTVTCGTPDHMVSIVEEDMAALKAIRELDWVQAGEGVIPGLAEHILKAKKTYKQLTGREMIVE